MLAPKTTLVKTITVGREDAAISETIEFLMLFTRISFELRRACTTPYERKKQGDGPDASGP